MKRDRALLEKRLTDICAYVALNSELSNKVYDLVKEKYNIPRGLTSDLVCLRMSMSETTEFVLFCILDVLIEVTGEVADISDFYTKQEINKYSKTKYKVNKIKFPLRLPMIQIGSDQWVGAIDNTLLMQMRAAQLINYNVNSQRTMQRIIKGDKEIYKITLNQKAVTSIAESLRNGLFVPNTITFNIPEDINANFYYDSEERELVIKELDHFDILDAYHRYIAACKTSDDDDKFEFTWELRIVNFSEDKAKKFIWQEDQKTKMKKLDSESFNMDDAANIVVTRLNENPRCNLKGLINRNDGVINFGELAELVRFFFFKKVSKKENNNLLILGMVKYLCECFNMLTEYDDKYISKKYSYKQLFIVVYMFYVYREQDKDEMCEMIDKMVEAQDKLDSKKFNSKSPRRSMTNELERLYEEVGTDDV